MINGINITEAILLSSTDRKRIAKEAKSLGVTHVRLEIPWGVVQPVDLAWPNGYDWTSTDDMIRAFADESLQICAVLGVHRAPWQTLMMPQRFGEMCVTVAQRYRWWVGTWEIWNEQNNCSYWSASSAYGGLLFNSGPKAEEYVPYLKIASQWIHMVQPWATVLFGGMAANLTYWNLWQGNVSHDPADFLKESYKAGVKGFFDGLAYHPYPLNDSFDGEQEPTPQQKFIAKIGELYKIMTDQNDSKPIHLTEWGSGDDNESVKAVRIAVAYPINASFPGVVSNYLYSLRDWNEQFGLLRSDWSHRPSYDAYQRLIR